MKKETKRERLQRMMRENTAGIARFDKTHELDVDTAKNDYVYQVHTDWLNGAQIEYLKDTFGKDLKSVFAHTYEGAQYGGFGIICFYIRTPPYHLIPVQVDTNDGTK